MEGKVKCSGCGHSWDKSDSSKKDMFICHQCGKDNVMKNGGWLSKYNDGGFVQPNANDSKVSMSEDFVGLGYNTKGRNYSPAFGGQFQDGGFIPASPQEQIRSALQPISSDQQASPYLQKKDPVEFYKSFINSPEYARRQLLTGYSASPKDEEYGVPNAAASRKTRLGSLENIDPITYDTRQPSDAKPGLYGGPSYININPSDYAGTSREAIEAHELGHLAGATTPGQYNRPGSMSAMEQDIFRKSMLPMKEPVLSGVQGSKEREASIRNLEDFQHLQKPEESKADLNALRYMMYDKGIYDITKGKKFTETDFEKAKQNLGKDRVFKRLENRMGKKNFVNLMNTIASTNTQEEEAPIAMNGASMPGSVGFTYARTAGSAPSEGKYAKKTMPSAQNGIMSPMLLARNVLNYFYPNEETASAVEAAPVNYKKGLTNELLQRQAYKESTFNPAAVSPAGYKGLTQIGEGVLKDYSNKKGGQKLDPFNPEDAVELQKFAMDDLYNASFINKPNQPDSVRIAKTLAAYNWGRGNLANYLNEQKQKGVDIYDSYDWLNNLPKETSDYVNKILLQEDPSFNKNYKKASTNPKYEEVTSLYDQKKFGGDIPSAQNGQEMRFYQNGLDFKPKGMQDGGEIYEGLELPEFVVEGKDERVKEAMSQGIKKFYGHIGELMGAPQKEAMRLITGKEQTPSEAFGFQNPGSWLDSYSSFGKNLSNFGMDAVLDPVNVIPGVGLIDDLTRGGIRLGAKEAAKNIVNRSITPIGYDPFTVAAAPLELITPNALKFKPKTFATKNRFDAWRLYNGLDPEFNTFSKNPDGTLAINDFRLGKDDLQKIVDNPKESFGTMEVEPEFNFGGVHGNGWISKGVDEEGRKFIDFTDTWDLQPFAAFSKLPERIRNFEVSSLSGGKPFDLKNRIYYDDKGNFFDHSRNKLVEEVQRFPKGVVKQDEAVDIPMLSTPNVAGTKQMDVLKDWNKATNQKFIKGTGTSAIVGGSGLGYSEYKRKKKSKEDKKKDGGIIKDNQGYLNPDNFGKVVEIDSNDITMEGVNQPLLGVSDTGDTKLMKPGKNYKFKGKKVTEYPVAKLGINQLDAQPMKKLNQLLNFTNNPDKDNWLDKYN